MNRALLVFQFGSVEEKYQIVQRSLPRETPDFLNLSLAFEEAVNNTFSEFILLDEAKSIESDGLNFRILSTRIFESSLEKLPESETHDVFVSLTIEFEAKTEFSIIKKYFDDKLKLRGERKIALKTMLVGTKANEIIELLRDNQPAYHLVDITDIVSQPEFTEARASLITAFTMYGAILISRAESQLGRLSVERDSLMANHKPIEEDVRKLWVKLTNINRYFCLISPAIRDEEREFCDAISRHYQIKERRNWLDNIRRDIDGIRFAHYSEKAQKDARYTRFAINYIVFAAVPATIFSALLAVNDSANIMSNGLSSLRDARILLPLAVSFLVGFLPACMLLVLSKVRAQ